MENQWDYMIRTFKARDIQDKSCEKSLQELGRLGWELLSIQDLKNGGELTFFFKRPLTPSAPEAGRIQYLPGRRAPEVIEAPAPDEKPLIYQESKNPPGIRTNHLPPKGTAPKTVEPLQKIPTKQFFPILEKTLLEDEEIIKTIQKNERHGIALTQKRLLLVKEEAWGNPKVISSEFIDIFEMDLRKFLDKYDFSMRFFDRKADMEKIEVIALEEEHIPVLNEIAAHIQNELSSIGRSLERGGILAENLPAR